MKNTYKPAGQNTQRNFLMQDLQINAFAEVSKVMNEKIAKIAKRFKK